MSSNLETLKLESRHLRGTLALELANAEPGFSEASQHLLKPHGFYQQKDRDRRKDAAPPPPALMVRGRIPAGRLDALAWSTWDRLADEFGDGSLRITTRQSLELHGILKGDLKATLKGLRDALQTSSGACGDVVRNVVAPPNPTGRPEVQALAEVAAVLSDHFRARSRAYAEIFLDGEPVDPVTEAEPIFGATYLPRKFKIAVTLAGENAVDLFTHDLGLAATWAEGRITGWHLFAGGGMGMSHGNDQTFPRLADPLGWFPAEGLLAVVEAAVTAYRDSGDRTNRKRARLKYVLHDRGAAWFRAEVETRSGVRFQDLEPPPWTTPSLLGWHAAGDGTYAFGLHTLSGRINDGPERRLKTALREAVARFHLHVQLTPEQDLILEGIPSGDRPALEALLRDHGVLLDRPASAYNRALACVALPWCGLAVAEAERHLPQFLDHLQAALDRHGKAHLAPTFRVTGCANGCARPYAAELALVGQAPERYVLWAGGDAEGTRLAFPVVEKVPSADLPGLFDRLVNFWTSEGRLDERLGAFAHRIGPGALAAALTAAPALSGLER
ncbi:MAG TPA: NADPH-dependent assimilatory sulfite reductase hemoprotein subunit [Holophagaceae bacterium]|nr:NADPH-dependent assimilatory sulfite reductase hemoprotein subunit [Holophagaceae bacterium]